MKKSIKKVLIAILCVLVVLSVTGCTRGSENPGVNDPIHGQGNETAKDKDQAGKNIDSNTERQWDGVKGKVLTGDYPEEIIKYLEDHKQNENQQAFNVNNKTYIVMTMGEQPSAGYIIELKDVVLKDGALKVFVKYEKPLKDDMVATVITYPSLVIETDDIYEGHYEILYDIEK